MLGGITPRNMEHPMDGENDLREQILQVEADLEELTDA